MRISRWDRGGVLAGACSRPLVLRGGDRGRGARNGDRDLRGGGGAVKLSSGEDWTGLQVDRRWGDGAVKVESDEPNSLRGKKGGCLIPVDVPGCGEGSLAGNCGAGRPRAVKVSLKSRGGEGGLEDAAVTGA